MQGWPELIPTNKKIDYMNSLMDVGYDILDCGSFVNPRMVPQMADSGEVVDNIDKSRSSTKLSVVIANFRGAEKALEHEKIDYLGFLFLSQKPSNTEIQIKAEKKLLQKYSESLI